MEKGRLGRERRREAGGGGIETAKEGRKESEEGGRMSEY
jgi:hypothetical protein